MSIMKQKLSGELKEPSSKTTVFDMASMYDSFYLDNDSNLGKSYAEKTGLQKNSKFLEKELRIMLCFHKNPFIVRSCSHHVHFGTKEKGETLCAIYMENASLGNLNKMICDAGGTLPEDTVKRATRMILQGLKALHSEGYIHCDLKSSKVLVFPSTTLGEPWDLKLAGFEKSKEPTMDSRLYFPGTLQYMPREATESFRFVKDDLLTGPARDTWALGRTVLEMFWGHSYI